MRLLSGIDLDTSYFKLGLSDRNGQLHGLGRVSVKTDEKLCFAASGSIINYYFHSCFFLWPVHYGYILFTPFFRENFLETGKSLDTTFKRHVDPIVTDERLGVFNEIVSHIISAFCDPFLRYPPYRVRNFR